MSASYQFDPMSAADLPLLRSWLAAPHVAKWWGEPEVELGYVRDMIEGRDTTRPFIFSVDGEPAGYIQYWFIGHHQNQTWIADHPWLAELPSDAIGVDLTIGDPDKLGKGIGSRVLRAFTERLVRQGYKHIIIDPDPVNHRAVRAYEKAGYRAITRLQGRTGDSLIMQYEMTSSDPHRASTP
ncbi:MAG TPA: GNAT family N-acetyltransferase [Hyphomicrobiaceae bacterium]|jgi:aminoglycoside 6'-N-acetyltransferase|nr:GNAT family N-acetyltransferase [Hyphomicrobiaceae bacterium]